MDRKISELDQVLNLDEQAEFPLSQDNGGTPTTFKAKLTQLAAKIAEAITFSNLITNDKHIIGAINEAAQGSGASMKFEDLSDVDINNLQDGQFSKYDSTTEKWKNTTIQESDVANLVSDLADKADKTDLVYEKTASGSIASFTDGGDDIPVSEYECEIVAQQASGTPTPSSPLSITGFSQADISVSGKNLFDESQIINASGWSESGGVYTGAVAQLYSYANNGFPKQPKYKENTQYTLSVYVNATDAVSRFRIYYTDGTYSDLALANNMVGTTQTHLTAPSKTIDKITFTYNSGGDLSISKIQLEENTTATTYEAHKGNTYLVEFGQTIYGGRLIYKNGQWSIEATYEITTINDDWNMYSAYFCKVFNDKVAPEVGDTDNYLLCSMLPYSGVKQYATQIPNETIGQANNKNIYIVDNSCADINEFHAKYNGATIIYPLETPVIIPITSSTRVKTISGVNNIFSNTGDNSVKYFTENADSLAELIKASESESTGDYHEYSTDEQVIGTWIDGNTLYEKTVVVTNKTAQPSDWAEVVTLSDVDKVAHVEGWFTISTVDYFEGYYVRFMFDHSTNKLNYYCKDMANTNGDITVIIRYTKTSSNTRSLNLSKGVEETEEKTEEVKEEEK